MPNNGLPLAVSLGDPSGIGPDIVISAWQRRDEFNLPPFLVTGCAESLKQRAELLQENVSIVEVDGADPALPDDGILGVVSTGKQAGVAGKPVVWDAECTISAILKGARLVHEGKCSGLVTCPVNKKILHDHGFEYPGHTEYLEFLARDMFGDPEAKSVMMLAAPEMRTVPVTVHIPLNAVSKTLSTGAIAETVRITQKALVSRFGIPQPKIAVTGLNPHAGESGTLGPEEEAVIVPAIQQLAVENIHVSGPWPADTLFHKERRGEFDAVVCMYHDQALIPVKALFFDKAVNVTLGLPFVRTSPDHGTAYDIAGSGTANPASFVEALKLAISMSAAS